MSDERIATGAHLTVDEVAAFVDHATPAAERERIEHHLVKCADCRAEIVAVRRLVPRRTRAWTVAVPLAAAAALLLTILPLTTSRRPAADARQVLRGAADRSLGIVAERPAARATLDADSVMFVWRPVAPEASYRLTLTNDRGDVVWSGSVSDTVVVLPSAVRLDRGRLYTWYVDALLADGRSVTSGLREFVTAR